MSDSTTPLPFDGERFTPECVREMRYEHYSRYAFAASFCRGLKVLDCACGEGYGSALLAQHADQVLACDLSAQAVAHAAHRYPRQNLRFVQADALKLPMPDASFDRVISFETLEHLADHDALLEEFSRVLKPDGVLLISTPDKRVYSDLTGQANPYHVRELYREEFEQLLRRHFPQHRLYNHKLMFQSVIADAEALLRPMSHTLENGELCAGLRYDATYMIAIASRSAAALRPFVGQLHLFGDAEESVYRHYEAEIRNGIYAAERIAELKREIEALRTQLNLRDNSAQS